MKKTISLFLITVLFALTLFIVIGCGIISSADDVSIKETIVFGDKSYAEGIKIGTYAHFDNHLFWNTEYTVGDEPEVKTEYEFRSNEKYQVPERNYGGIYLSLDIKYGFDINEKNTEGIGKAYLELYNKTEPGTTSSMKIRLQDYYDYYPLHISIDLPGVLWQGGDYDYLTDVNVNEIAVIDAFRDYFKIPIPEELPEIEISITKDKHGNGSGVSSSAMIIDYYPYTTCAFTDNKCYFTFNNRFSDGKEHNLTFADTSLIPGGFGIYCFDYKNVKKASNSGGSVEYFKPGYVTGVDAESLKTVYPLDKSTIVENMSINEQLGHLILFTEENRATYMTVFDINTFEELQRMKVSDETNHIIKLLDDFIVIEGSKYISVVSISADGVYYPDFTAERRPDINPNAMYKGIDCEVLYDGKRLIVVSPILSFGDDICDFYIAIYTKDGLVYYAEYESSLSKNSQSSSYSKNCHPIKFTIRLE